MCGVVYCSRIPSSRFCAFGSNFRNDGGEKNLGLVPFFTAVRRYMPFFLSFINFTVILQCCQRMKTVCVGGYSCALRFECKQTQTRSSVRFSKSKKKKRINTRTTIIAKWNDPTNLPGLSPAATLCCASISHSII